MREWSLYIDESGDFDEKGKEHFNPSLVGGLLIEKNKLTDVQVAQLLGKEYVHSNQESSKYKIEVLKKVKAFEGFFVIFQNSERIKIVDSDTTYINLLVEGIIQTILKLSLIDPDFRLNIIIAKRKNMSSGKGVIEENAYISRLRERLIISGVQNYISINSPYILLDDARTNKFLMVADVICNTFLTRTSKKFTDQDRKMINELYSSNYMFSFIRDTAKSNLEKKIERGNLGEALFELFTKKELILKDKEELLIQLINRLKILDDFTMNIHLTHLTDRLKLLIRNDRSYTVAKSVIEEIQETLVGKLEYEFQQNSKFKLDISMLLYTIYTHQGSYKANLQEGIFENAINTLPDIFIRMTYFHLYGVRKSIHLKNLFDFENSIKVITNVINILMETTEMAGIVGYSNDTKQKNESLGKALGTRGQLYTLMNDSNPEYSEMAIKDYLQAIDNFTDSDDISRQFLYLTFHYCKLSELDLAIKYLNKALKVQSLNENFEIILSKIFEQSIGASMFSLYAYVAIMNQLNKVSISRASQMYHALNKSGVQFESLIRRNQSQFPLCMSLCHMSQYLFANDKRKYGLTLLESAIKMFDSLEDHQVTLKVIKLGLLAEHVRQSKMTNRLSKYTSEYEQLSSVLSEYNTINRFFKYSLTNPINNLEIIISKAVSIN